MDPSVPCKAPLPSGRQWDYCSVTTLQGCSCANTWLDPSGATHAGDCLSEGGVSWCATDTRPGYYVNPDPTLRSNSDRCACVGRQSGGQA